MLHKSLLKVCIWADREPAYALRLHSWFITLSGKAHAEHHSEEWTLSQCICVFVGVLSTSLQPSSGLVGVSHLPRRSTSTWSWSASSGSYLTVWLSAPRRWTVPISFSASVWSWRCSRLPSCVSEEDLQKRGCTQGTETRSTGARTWNGRWERAGIYCLPFILLCCK